MRVVRLDKGVGRVNLDSLPADDECFLAELTSWDVHVIRAFLFPYSTFTTRWVRPLTQRLFEVGTEQEYADSQELLEGLDVRLGGELMSCTDIREGLEAIAASLAALQGCTTNVNCGSCAGQQATIPMYMSGLEPDEILPQEGIEEPDPEGEPPEGFESWEVYYARKCKAAHFLWLAIRNLLLSLTTLSGTASIVSATGPLVLAWVYGTGVIFPPGAIALLMTYIIAAVAINAVAAGFLIQAIQYWDENKDSIVCSLYWSGSAQEAIDSLADAYEDAIEAIVWTGALEPLGGALAAAFGLVGTTAINTNLVNVMFEVVEDVVFPDETCDCGQTAWHFDEDAEGWTWYEDEGNTVNAVTQWQESPSPADSGDSSEGCLEAVLDLPDGGFTYSEGCWRLPGSGLPSAVAHEGDTFSIHGYKSSNVGSVVLYAKIKYSDDAEDYDIDNNQAWQTMSAVVSAGNDGKTIAYLIMGIGPSGDDRNPVTWYFDHAEWIPLS